MAVNARLAGELNALLNEYCERTGSTVGRKSDSVFRRMRRCFRPTSGNR